MYVCMYKYIYDNNVHLLLIKKVLNEWTRSAYV